MHHAVFTSPDRRALALLTGAAIGALGALFGLLIVVPGGDAFRRAGRAWRRAYVLSRLHAALYAMFAVIALLPFANFRSASA